MPSFAGRSGVRVFILLTALAAAVLVVLVATGPFERDGQSGTAKDRVVNASRPEVRHALGQEKRQRARIASRPAKQDRLRSRTRYRKLSATHALRVGRQLHRDVLRDRTPRPMAAARKRGMVVERYPSKYAAVLRQPKGAARDELGVMATSTLPMRSRDSTGQTRLVDLSLRQRTDGWAPDNARTKVWIGDRAGDGFRVSEREIGVAPLDVTSQTAGTQSGDAVFFANSAKDADHIVRVTPAGAESLVQLRSADSPQRFRYRINLPAGGTLREQSDGSIAVSIDGRREGLITKPTAWDADHRAIAVKTTLRGDLLTLDVAHRGRDIRYPAMVDPNYVDLVQYRWYRGGFNSTTNQYWSYSTNQPSVMGGTFGNYQNGMFGQTNGLYSVSRGNQYVPAGSYGYWRFNAPGTTSVLQAEWGHLSHIAIYAGGPPPCIDYGLTSNTGAWRVLGLDCANFAPAYRLSCWDCNDRDGFSYDPAVKGATFGTHAYAATIANFSDYLGESTVYLADPDDPTVTVTSQPSTAWTNTPTGTIAATAADPGLGVESMEITPANTKSNPNCLTGGPCSSPLTHSASVASLNLPDGNNSVDVIARDASYIAYRDAAGNIVPGKHQGKATATVKLDRQPPTIQTPSGSLFDARDGFVGPNQDYTLSVTATDGAPTPASAQRSGVTSLTATLDGEVMTDGSAAAACTGPASSCSLSISPRLTGVEIAAMGDGTVHTLAITATDALGQVSDPTTLMFKVDLTPPSSSPNGIVAAQGADGGAVPLTGTSYRLLADATDNDLTIEEVADNGELQEPRTPGSGVQSMVLKIDDQTKDTMVPTPACTSVPGCEKSLAYTWDTTNVPNGPHTFDVIATDKVGNVDVNSWTVTVEHPVDQPPRANNVARTITGAPNMRAGTSVAAVGDINADGHADYVVGAPGETIGGKAAGAAYLVLGSSSESTTDLATGSPNLRKISGPSDAAASPAYCGNAVASAGDINGDEIGDLLIGCPGLNSSDILAGLTSTTGKVYVVFGSTTPQNIDLSNLGEQGFVINGSSETAGLGVTGLLIRPAVFGERLSSAPTHGGETGPTQDVNGDGLNDIIIGDSAANSAYVIFGRVATTPLSANTLGSAGYAITGTVGLVGHSAAIVDDVTDDGLADTVVGAPGSTNVLSPGLGAAYIVPGSAVRTGSLGLATPAQGIVRLASGVAGDRFGTGVAGLGDTDLDGRADIAVATKSGAFVVRTAPTESKTITAADGFAIASPTANTGGLLGVGVPETSIAPAGDIDGDERQDLILGYPDAGPNRAYTILSPEGSPTISASAALAGQTGSSVNAGTTGERSGAAVSGNGFQAASPVTEHAQGILGAPLTNPGLPGVSAGAAYIIRERTPTGHATTIDAEESPPTSAARSVVDPPGLFIIDDPWVSVRNKYAQFVIGAAPGGVVQNVQKEEHRWTFGYIYYPTVRRCGWIDTVHFDDETPDFPYLGRRCNPGPGYLAPKYFSRLFNCDVCADGNLVNVRNAPAGSGGWPVYRNVHPGTTEHKHNFAGRLKDNASIRWRYITKSGRYVLARIEDPSMVGNASLDEQNWAYVPRAALPPAFGPGGLCGGRDHGIQATGDDNEGDPRPGRFGPGGVPLWPPVCSRTR